MITYFNKRARSVLRLRSFAELNPSTIGQLQHVSEEQRVDAEQQLRHADEQTKLQAEYPGREDKYPSK